MTESQSKRSFRRPAFLEAAADRVARQPCDLRPTYEGMRLFVGCDVVVAFAIACLLFAGSPATVLGAVGPVVVDPVDGVLGGWTASHIFVEVFKPLPSLTDCDPSPSVSVEVLAIGTGASIPHFLPGAPFRRLCHSVSGFPALFPNCLLDVFTGHFLPVATAALGRTITEVITKYHMFGAAIADALPSGIVVSLSSETRRLLYDKKSSKPSSYYCAHKSTLSKEYRERNA